MLGLDLFQEVRRHLGTDAAHIYGGMLATLMTFAEERSIAAMGVPVGSTKKQPTAKGSAMPGSRSAGGACRASRREAAWMG